ncbi:hypothetical protein GCM10007423_08920 [Dyadobacter endophyticus]|uniref:Por secretion system C-terminal sorting domain-containing protein n=1 Tax=Dyadobacter endophyticus TaxID=1749036 RepID=A0ABQ1YHT9_9BACT|nr:T9SS type A sorting domain-containing protein [Dyadobacter endophyticus]GGH25015.1 hypothetical protein GCM10007423_08920 [Dyadobacter endophyticus]
MKRIIILILITAAAGGARAQNTTYGGANAPANIDGGYFSDYSPGGTIVLPDGLVTLANGATYEHGNNLLQINGNWTSTGSLDIFQAIGLNSIIGNVAPSFSNVRFNIGAGNTMAISNTQGIGITGNLQFNNGITTTVRTMHTTGSLRFSDGATYTGGSSDAQHVNGYVTKVGNDAFVFPVGSGTDLRTLSISAPAAAATISTAWFAGSPDAVTDPSDGGTHSRTAIADPVKAVSEAGFWDWLNPAGSDDNITVTVSIPDLSNFALTENLRLVGWNGTQWIDLSAGFNASGNTENSTLTGIIPAGTAITAIAVGSVEMPLPVTLVSFTGRAVENTSVLQWATTEEVNASHFEIQRSNDAKSFESIGEVNAKGESKVLVNYLFTDKTPLPGINYYRLKQIDQDGSHAFSKTISIAFDTDAKILVYPNPVTDFLRVESSKTPGSLEIFNLSGLRLQKRDQVRNGPSEIVPGPASVVVDLRSYPIGIYILKVDGQTFKIIKK